MKNSRKFILILFSITWQVTLDYAGSEKKFGQISNFTGQNKKNLVSMEWSTPILESAFITPSNLKKNLVTAITVAAFTIFECTV